MQIAYTSTGALQLKTKSGNVSIDPQIVIGNFTIPGAGEYDIASIQCEGHALSSSVAYFLRSEELNITVLADIDPSITKLDDAANTDILVVEVKSNDTPEALAPVIKALEPAYVFLLGPGANKNFATTLNLPLAEESALKLGSRNALPVEGTTLFLPV